MNPDKLRRNSTALAFVKAFFDARNPVAVICHGPWTLIDAGVVGGRRITSYPSLQTDLKNAGAEWVDEEGKGGVSAPPGWAGENRRARLGALGWSWTRAWSRAGNPMTSRPSTGRWWKSSRKAVIKGAR